MHLTIPYNYQPLPWHLRVLQNPARFKVIVAHRKARKTTLALNELIRWAFGVPGTYWYIAPYYGEAKKTVWQDPEMLAKYVPPSIWNKRNNSELYIPFPNGSVLYILGADNPSSHRGPNPKGVVLDEYDTMRPEMWSAVVQPIMIANPNAWTWFVGTYAGVKDLHAKYVYSQNNPGWFGMVLKASLSGIIAPEMLEEARRTTTEAYFKQEFECEAIEGASSFFTNINDCIYEGNIEQRSDHQYQLGVDLAKYNDYTVISPFDLCTFRLGKQERFNQIDYTLQKARIEAAYLRFNRGQVIIDSTGVGEPVYDDLYKQKIKIEPFHFNEQSRTDLLNNFQILIATGKIKIPNDENLLNELRAMQYVLSGRKIRIQVPDGSHDDCIMSAALAVWNLPANPLRARGEDEREILRQFDAHRTRTKQLTGSRYLRR